MVCSFSPVLSPPHPTPYPLRQARAARVGLSPPLGRHRTSSRPVTDGLTLTRPSGLCMLVQCLERAAPARFLGADAPWPVASPPAGPSPAAPPRPSSPCTLVQRLDHGALARVGAPPPWPAVGYFNDVNKSASVRIPL